MSVANFFDKILLGASQWLKNYDRGSFEAILESHTVLVLFDKNGAETSEGKASLDMVTRLLARLYPNVTFSGPEPMKIELERLAVSINPNIVIESNAVTICIVIGQIENSVEVPTFYIGSEEWICKFSTEKPLGSNDSGNPFGAGAAACMAVANIFRLVFRTNLPHSELDVNFSLSLLDYSVNQHNVMLNINHVSLNETHLVGLGAIGHGTLWTLKNIPNLQGMLVGIDDETISLSNLQRYLLTDQESIDKPKTDLAKQYLQDSDIVFEPISTRWDAYIALQKDWLLQRIAVCVDNAQDRIMIQGSLPRKIFNAWTQPENIGVSRHLDFGNDPCLCCLYLPSVPKKSRSQEVADNLNLLNGEQFIRRYLANQYPVDETLVSEVANANQLDDDSGLRKYIGQPMQVFYSEIVCGGVLMNLNGSDRGAETENLQVPSAFESAFAGILLAAELVKDQMNYKPTNQISSVRFNLIRSLGEYLQFPEAQQNNCICLDKIYKETFNKKWSL